MSLAAGTLRFLDTRVRPEPLAATRIAVGACAFGVAWEARKSLSLLLTGDVVPLPYVAWLPRVPLGAVPALSAAMFVAAGAFLVGFKTRVAGSLLLCLSAYTLLLDERTYTNHLYLFVLIVLLLTIADSGAALSLDALRSGTRDTVPAWPLTLLKIQASLVYGFAAVAKLTSAFVSGDVLAETLRTQGWFVFPAAWRIPAWMGTLAVSAIVLEFFVAAGLWNRRLRWPAVAIGMTLHAFMVTLLDSSRLSLAIFALELMAIYPLFFQPDSRPDPEDRTARPPRRNPVMWKSVVMCCVGTMLVAAPPALAQESAGPNRWGLAVSFAPAWKVPESGPLGTLAEKSLRRGEVGYDISGADFRVGVVRGGHGRADWGVSLVQRSFKDDSTQGAIVKKCIQPDVACFVEGREFHYHDAALTGIEANKFFSLVTIGNRIQIGADLAAGVGWYHGKAERRDALNIFVPTSTEPILSFDSKEVPASRLSKMHPLLLGRAEVAVAVDLTRDLKVRVGGGMNYPGVDLVSVSLMYFFGSNR